MPTLTTDRLLLRPFCLEDARDVQRLAGDYDIARTTLFIPHPYKDGMAEAWISTHQSEFEAGTQIIFAITHRQEKYLIGAIGLSNINAEFEKGEIGYWIGKPYWNLGYCSEAARAVLEHCFNVLEFNRVTAHHFSTNPASGRVMEKIGMKKEGVLRQNVKKWGEFLDTPIYSILRCEFLAATEDGRH